MSRKSNKEIPVTNIIKLVLIVLFVIIAVLFLRGWYLKGQDLQKGTPILSTLLTHQIKPNELESYIHETDTAILFMCTTKNDQCRDLEKDMKKIVKDNSLEDIIIYFDISMVDDFSKIYKQLNDNSSTTLEIDSYPAIIYLENSKIQKFANGAKMSVSDVQKFLREIKVLL